MSGVRMKRVLDTLKNSFPVCTEYDDNHVLVSMYVPEDYEACGECGFDHSYEWQEAHNWHKTHDPNNELYK